MERAARRNRQAAIGAFGACWRAGWMLPGMLALTLLILFAVSGTPAEGAEPKQLYLAGSGNVARLSIPLNKSETIMLDGAFAEARIGSPEIAEIVPLNDHSIYVLARGIGTTNISLFDSLSHLVGIIEVEVTRDAGLIQAKIREMTGSSIAVTDSGGQLVLSGLAADASVVDQATQIAGQFAPGAVINTIKVADTQQVLLKVRFVEASRAAGRELGIRWDAIGSRGRARVGFEQYPPGTFPPDSAGAKSSPLNTAGALLLSGAEPFGVVLANLVNNGFNIDLLLKALEDKSLARRLAEPNLVALSGDTASFLAGGEFPYPIPTEGEIPAVDFKEFGVRLTFTPTVLRNGHINLRLEPEVSTLDFGSGVTAGVPALSTRRASTTIELRDGQSFAIAGLLQSTSSRQIAQLPWISSIPILGALFRSTRYQNLETDLVIIVTPHLVRPAAPGQQVATPLDTTLPANDVDLFLKGKLELPKEYRYFVETGGRVKGPYGHMLGLEYGYEGMVVKR